MTTTHTVREWLEQLPEPFSSQAILWMKNNSPLFLNNPCHRMGNAIAYMNFEATDQGWDYWIKVSQGYCDQPFKEPASDSMIVAQESQSGWKPLSNLLDPSEGWTQEGFVWWNEHGDSIRPCRNLDRPGWMDVCIVQDKNAIIGDFHTSPSALSAMAMVNQYRREQWR